MPYITCDGRTYSRYDNSPYVQECIRKERLMYEAQERACTADPQCRADREFRNNLAVGTVVVGLVFFFFSLGRALYLIERKYK